MSGVNIPSEVNYCSNPFEVLLLDQIFPTIKQLFGLRLILQSEKISEPKANFYPPNTSLRLTSLILQ